VSDPIIDRIQRESGVPDLVEVLADRLDPTDLQSLLLAVYRRRATRITPAQLLTRYEQDRFVGPSDSAPATVTAFDHLAWSILADQYTPIELSPVCPLGTVAAIATVDQNKVVTTIRNTEVVADSTNVLALECAVRRRRLLHANPRSRERVRLCASHRLVRGQAYRSARASAHFRLLGLCAAGRDEGSFQFETTSLVEQIDGYLRLLHAAARLGCHIDRVRVAVTDLDQGRRERALDEQVLRPLQADHPGLRCEFDPDRETGRGYYVDACFHLYATNAAGAEFLLVDGGFTTWTRDMLSNAKERLLISGLGIERLYGQFRAVSVGGA
jgi:hypothetical protein